jgi:hypothetical protein
MRMGHVLTAVFVMAALVSVSGCPSGPITPPGNSLAVTTLTDVADGDVTSVDALRAAPGVDGVISLREALLAVNASGGNRTIRFDVAGTIGPLTPLPVLGADRITLDGQDKITLDGGLRSGLDNGIEIIAADCIVRNLNVQRFPGDGIVLTGVFATDNRIEGCRIGTNGTSAQRNGRAGVRMRGGARSNVIGGSTDGAGNLISGNDQWGVVIESISAGRSTGNRVQGNFIGSNELGNLAVPNKLGGVLIADSSENLIGGTTAVSRNVITGNTGPGIEITGSITALAARENVIQGNFIGTNASAGAGPGNVTGVRIAGQVFDTLIGGTTEAEGNVIAGNTDAGVAITTGAGNAIRRNSIFDNNGTGIVLTNAAANDGMPAPVITKLSPNLTGTAEPNAIVEFFVDSEGEGGFYTIRTTATAQGTFTLSGLNFGNFSGLDLTATATDRDGNTSEFSAAFPIP